MIIGTGTDILSTQRVQYLISSYGDQFLERWFSPDEIAWCRAKNRPYLHFAARMAAKEAVAKAIRMQRDDGVPWRDIEIGNDSGGVPFARLTGRPLERSRELNIATIHVSLSHCDEYATATAVSER